MDWLAGVWSWLSGAISVAVIAAFAGASVSYLVAGRNVYINSITAERSKWIEKLRINLAAYSAAVALTKLRMLNVEHDGDAKDVVAKLEEQNELASLIQLQLNPMGAIDKNILKIIGCIVVRSSTPVDLMQKADDLLIEHSQWLLKAEWEKVKFEARGPLWRFRHRNDARDRLAEYTKWAEGKGAIDGLERAMQIEREKPAAFYLQHECNMRPENV